MRQIRHIICLLSALLALSFTNIANSQTPNNQTIAAVQTVINMFLLSEDESEVFIELGDYSPKSYNFNDQFQIQFPPHGSGDVELCFVVRSARGLSTNDLLASFNDNSALSVVVGENCFRLPSGSQIPDNVFTLVLNSSNSVNLSGISVEPADRFNLTLSILSRSQWDERAVRKVLKVFAFGGHARDQQILTWANMPAQLAIRQMLNFDQHNLRLSALLPGERYASVASQHGTLRGFAAYLASRNSNSPIPLDFRRQYGLNDYNFPASFSRMVTTRGLNPFRQRIGFWETNYHLAVNLDASVSHRQLAKYYDDIMQVHASGVSYEKVMAEAAKSAAIAMQYGHRRNEWIVATQECECNEDFAREIHQLFYGIFGVDDPNHEDVTIKETAKMLTGMPVDYISGFGFALSVGYSTNYHHTADVNILGRTIRGNTAARKIDNLMPISIQHPESLRNLPVMIIAGLADDNLNETRANQVRAAWAAMGNDKRFLQFIRAYATSELFHSPEQIKYFTSFERAWYTSNKVNLDNIESLLGGDYYYNDGALPGRQAVRMIRDDNSGSIFRPVHNVFGGQTSFEAADSALAFEKNYNRSTEDEYLTRVSVNCDDCALGQAWEKSWAEVLPSRNGDYLVKDVARWLWKHVVGNLDSYSTLEQAHLHSILGAARRSSDQRRDQDLFFDLPLLLCIVEDYRANDPNANLSLSNLMTDQIWYNHCAMHDDGGQFTQAEQDALNRVYTGDDITNDPIISSLVTQMGNVNLHVANSNSLLRERSMERIQSALNFILATPFVFAEGGQ